MKREPIFIPVYEPNADNAKLLFDDFAKEARKFKYESESQGPGTYEKEIFVGYFYGLEFTIKFKAKYK